MRKMIASFLCIFCFFFFSAFDWGGGKKAEKSTPVKTSASTTQSYSSSTASKTATVAPQSGTAQAVLAATKLLGTGTPEEKQARIESLNRLGTALAKAKNQKQMQ